MRRSAVSPAPEVRGLDIRDAPALERRGTVIAYRLATSRYFRLNHQSMHHVVLFMLQDVAVPHVLMFDRLFVLNLQFRWAGRLATVVHTVRPVDQFQVLVNDRRQTHFMMTRVTVPGYIGTVSFQPSSFSLAG